MSHPRLCPHTLMRYDQPILVLLSGNRLGKIECLPCLALSGLVAQTCNALRAPCKSFDLSGLPHMGCAFFPHGTPFNIDGVCFTAHACRHYANLLFVYASCASPPTGRYHPIGERMPLVCTLFTMPVNMYAVCFAPIRRVTVQNKLHTC